MLARAKDIPAYVEAGIADIGITGNDIYNEAGREITLLTKLPFGYCRLVYATKTNNGYAPKRIATAFPNLARKYLDRKGLAAEIVVLDGAVEASVAAGMADAVIDLTSTGKTLAENDLMIRDELLCSSAVIIANTKALASKKQKLAIALNALAPSAASEECPV
ncbi:ATP phosphoribosyltransferase [Candidatus Micrarchaeota archaeon CG1_02_55_22]|nr:MAG: ATP phosphoribosyltransferase [Candidatus Micrarchaeota archaeon CG1_02_55_22]